MTENFVLIVVQINSNSQKGPPFRLILFAALVDPLRFQENPTVNEPPRYLRHPSQVPQV